MLELFCVMIGIILGAGGMYLGMRGKNATQTQAIDQNENQYYELWSNAVNLLGTNGQLTPEQISAITPKAEQTPVQQPPKLRKMNGISSHRRDVEIERAQQGLPPADNLKGMISAHIRDVKRARLRHGTEQ